MAAKGFFLSHYCSSNPVSRSKSRFFFLCVSSSDNKDIVNYFLPSPLMNPGMINFLFIRAAIKKTLFRTVCVCVGNPLSVSHDVFLKGLRASLVVTTSLLLLLFHLIFISPLCVWETAVCQSETASDLRPFLPLYAFLCLKKPPK